MSDSRAKIYPMALDLASAVATRWLPVSHIPAGGLAPHGLNVLFQVRLGPSGLRAPVVLGVLAVSSRTVMNNVG